MVHRVKISGATSDNNWHNEWYNEWQRMTTSDNEWQRVAKRDKEWQRVVQRVTTNVNEWPFQLIFLFFQIREEPTTKHPKENFLNLAEDLWRRPIELRPETSTQKEILTVRSSTSQIFTKIVFLKNFAICVGDSNTGAFLWILRNF